ncbi:MAG: YggS family pyridoxal phosphate-dependent enzyme [Gammaproteobacteria bacterium]|nr:YggS family pyridoxal phosphate-dependent enzyme [Gammaproteobacteria bacterium]
MLISPQNLAENLQSVRERLAAAARSAGRPEDCVTLVAVSKGQLPEAIARVAALGQRDVGESYPQEALPKIESLRLEELCWHFIGQVQSNKTRLLAEHFQWVHGIDRAQIATRLNSQRPHYAPVLNVCVQVKLGEEPGKGGVAAHELAPLVAHLAALPRLRLRGLMCIPPPEQVEAEQRRRFARLRELMERLVAAGHPLDVLSMGMSGDFEAAVREGATHVRIGTAIFGPREP